MWEGFRRRRQLSEGIHLPENCSFQGPHHGRGHYARVTRICEKPKWLLYCRSALILGGTTRIKSLIKAFTSVFWKLFLFSVEGYLHVCTLDPWQGSIQTIRGQTLFFIHYFLWEMCIKFIHFVTPWCDIMCFHKMPK